MFRKIIPLLRRRAAPAPEAAPTAYVSFQLEKRLSRDATIIWVLDRELRERSRYWVYRN